LFYFLSKIGGTLRTAKLPSELLTQKDRIIKVRIGKPISVEEQNEHKTIEEYSEFLRKKTYMLAKPFEKDSKFLPSASDLKISKSPKQIVNGANQENLID
jgi:CO dehydrogenase/acetyl-CoA synthase beta subunit